MELSREVQLLVDGCKKWEEAVDRFRALGLYSEEDYEPLRCVVSKSGWAEIVVGSAPGHRTRIDMRKKTLEYYDTDNNVNEVMADLLRDAGADCNIRDDGVFCNIEKADVLDLFPRLAAATSMDYRLGSPRDFWKRAGIDLSECEGYRDEKFELCAVKKVLEEI